MSQNEKYTLLLMRDDSSVRRMRVSRGWLKFLVILLLLIVVCGGLSIWLGSKLWFENRELQAEVQELRQENNRMLVRLDRLSTVERILQNTDPKEVGDLLSMIGTQQPPGDAPEHPVSAILPPVPPTAPENGGAPAGTANGAVAANGTPVAPTTPIAPATPATPSAPATTNGPAARNTQPGTIDEGKVTLENLLARPVQSDTRLELAYDMVNLDPAVRAEGRLKMSVMTGDNELYPLALTPAASYYSMSSRKIVPRFTLALPEKAQGGAAKALVVEMQLNDRLSLRRIYDLPVMPSE